LRPTLLLAAATLIAAAAPARADQGGPPPQREPSEDDGFTLSGQLRERATYLSAVEYDADAETAGWFWTQRALIAADAGLSENLRLRASVVSALIEGGEEDSPIERNDLDLQEAYIELGPRDAFVRIGRQEIRLGTQRLLAVRDGTNVRRNWDGVRGSARFGAVTLDAFALRLVDTHPEDIFNDGRDEGRDLAGVQAAFPAPIGRIETYYLYTTFDDRRTIEGVGDERRHSLGLRAFGDSGGLSWNWEAVYQFGRFGDGDIRAWTIATNTTYRWEEARWTPEIMLSLNAASGDGDAGDGDLGTFSALYPNASYFSENAVLGPANFFNVHPYFRLYPRENLKLGIDVNWYWRMEREDGVYGPPGNLFRLPEGARERLVDVSVSGGIEWEASEHIFVSLLFTHSAPQAFIRATGPADAIDFVEATLQFDF
jgi:hypothetical protein